MGTTSSAMNQLASAQMDFSLGLLRNVTFTEKPIITSTVLSPFSLSIMLSMVYAGARGETRRELGTILTGSKRKIDKATVFDFFGTINRIRVSDKVLTLESGSQLFVDHNLKIMDTYKQLMERHFMGTLEKVDYSMPHEAAKIINDYVNKKTHGKISSIVTPDAIKPISVRLMLINAIYFAGKWMQKFDPKNTIKSYFYMTEDVKRLIDMMCMEERHHKYFANDQFQMLILPYEKTGNNTLQNIEMVMVLPRKYYGLSTMLAALDGSTLLKCIQNARLKEVMISLPKFRIKSEHSLKETLMRMGVRDSFSGSADFRGIVKAGKKLSIADVFQKAFIEMDEMGTTAAAATGMTCVDGPSKTIKFHANHPFAFFIIAKYTEKPTVLFAGVMAGS